MEISGDKLSISYVAPRRPMQSEGVKVGTILFSGTILGNGAIHGQAYRFSGRCNAAVPYQASGSIDPTRRTIKVYGNVNYLNDDCQTVPSKTPESLEFQKQL
jgi:hypothetical protein